MDSIVSWAVLSIGGLAAIGWLLLAVSREACRTTQRTCGMIRTASPVRACLEIQAETVIPAGEKRRRAQAVATPELSMRYK